METLSILFPVHVSLRCDSWRLYWGSPSESILALFLLFLGFLSISLLLLLLLCLYYICICILVIYVVLIFCLHVRLGCYHEVKGPLPRSVTHSLEWIVMKNSCGIWHIRVRMTYHTQTRFSWEMHASCVFMQ